MKKEEWAYSNCPRIYTDLHGGGWGNFNHEGTKGEEGKRNLSHFSFVRLPRLCGRIFIKKVFF